MEGHNEYLYLCERKVRLLIITSKNISVYSVTPVSYCTHNKSAPVNRK